MHKKFVYYQTRAQYDTDVLLTGNSQVIFPDQIIFIEDTGDIITHGVNYNSEGSSHIETITDTEVELDVEPNTVYKCVNKLKSLSITSFPNNDTKTSVILFIPDYGSQAQQDQLCPITLPQGVSMINFNEENYRYNKQAIIAIKYGLLVFGQ